MKRTLPLILLVLLSTTLTHAANMLHWESKPSLSNDQRVITHGKSKRVPSDCATLRVRIQPRIPKGFTLREASGDFGRDDIDLRWTDEQDYFYFYFHINPNNPIRYIILRADGYEDSERVSVNFEAGKIYDATIRLMQRTRLMINIQTIPGDCQVLDYKTPLGRSDEMGFFMTEMELKDDVLNYTKPLTFRKEGYEEKRYPCIMRNELELGHLDTVNMVLTLPLIELDKIGAAKTEQVTIYTASDVKLYMLRSDEEGEPKTVSLGGNYSAKLEEGTYIIKAEKPGYAPGNKTIEVKKGNPVVVTFDKFNEISGTLHVKSKPSGAAVIVDGQRLGNTPFTQKLPIGQHTLSLQKHNYIPSSTITVNIVELQTVDKTISLYKTENLWWSGSQYYPHHYMEAYYGMGFLSGGGINHYIGANYTYIPHAIGFNLSMMYGFNNGDIVATAGPALTLTTESKTDLDLQLLLGAGYASIQNKYGERTGTWVAEAGLRFGFENFVTGYNFSWWSLFLGAKYYDQKVVPTIGISLMPVGLLALGGDYFTDDTEHAGYFFEPMAGYACVGNDWLVGATFAWQTYNLGLYTSFMYGVVEGSIAAVAGPAIHLTEDTDRFDLSLYGGIGYGRLGSNLGYDRHHVAGDLGLRFGFSSTDFSWWDFSIGCMTFGGEWVPNIGLSWGITGATAAVAGSAVLAIWAGGGI